MKKCLIIAFILIFGIAILSTYITYQKTNSENIIENKNPQNIMENVESTNQLQTSDEQTTSELVNNSITQSKKEVTKKTPVAESETEVKNNKNSTPQVATNNKQSIAEVSQGNTEIKKDNDNTLQTKDESIQVQPEKTEQEVVKEEKSVTIGEEYKTNDTMINTIKNVINSNQSEDMKLYGYNIVIDSSIVEDTSQFTYTKQRVIDKIKYKFGTIKIYARDYYNNGQFICTQCYIIQERRHFIDIEKLANKIVEYEANYNWYDLVDDYGNIEIDSEARKNLLEETLRTLQNSPDVIISHLKVIKEDLECDETFENDKEYQETKELIDEIEKLKAEQIDESLEI